jgi:hypothetical protein
VDGPADEADVGKQVARVALHAADGRCVPPDHLEPISLNHFGRHLQTKVIKVLLKINYDLILWLIHLIICW